MIEFFSIKSLLFACLNRSKNQFLFTNQFKCYLQLLSLQSQQKMRDQPFKKFFPVQKAKSRQSYRYPTYQHYYDGKVSKLNQNDSPRKQMQIQSQKIVDKTEEKIEVVSTSNNKKAQKSNLKVQLDNLKFEVQRIMQKKRGVLRSPIEKKLFQSLEKVKIQPELVSSTERRDDIDDTQSVNSEKILNQPLKRLEQRRSTQNYDHEKYMQLENDLLKTELRTLKNKYVNKKNQLNEKIGLLEKKVNFLETSLFNSQQSLEAEISSLKESLKQVQKEEKPSLIPTSDKSKSFTQMSPTKDALKQQQSLIIKERMAKLYDELAQKNKKIYEKDELIENISNELAKYKKQASFGEERVKSLTKQLQQIKKIYNKTIDRLNEQSTRNEELEKQIQKQKRNIYDNSNSELSNFEVLLETIKKEYEKKLDLLNEQLQEASLNSKKFSDEKLILEEELKFIKVEEKQNKIRIENLTQKVKQEKDNASQIEEKYLKIIERNEKKNEETIANIHLQYQTKVISLSKKDSKSVKDHSSVDRVVSEKKYNASPESIPGQEREIRRWKLQYKQLKEKYEQHIKLQTNKRNEIKENYKNYRDYKQKVEVYAHKLKLFEKQFDKYLGILTEKQSQLLKKQIQLRKLTNDYALDKNTFTVESTSINQKYKLLEQKYNEEVQKGQKTSIYCKQLEQKMLKSSTNDESLKESMSRIKKRLDEQDEKSTKMIKDIKNKEALITKLKKQLREVMETLEKRLNEEKTKQIDEVINTYTKKQFDTFKEWKNRCEAEKKLLQENNNKLIIQIQQLKVQILQKDESLNKIQNELSSISHSYNLKNIEVSDLVQEREMIIQGYNAQLQEINEIKLSIQNVLRDEIMRKNEQISILRTQITAQNIRPNQFKSFNPTFDNILKGNMQQNKKLRDDLGKKVEQIFRLRDNYSVLRSQYQNLKAQIEINKLKTLAQKKNMQVNSQIQIQKVQSEFDMSQKKSISLQQKIKLLMQENRKKDSFIQNYIMSKKIAEAEKNKAVNFIKQYELTVGSNDIIERLACQTRQIQKLNNYNHILLKEISVLKQKLLLYEAIDEEKVSFYDSKISKYSANSSQIKEEMSEDVDFQKIKLQKKDQHSKLRKTESLQEFTLMEHES